MSLYREVREFAISEGQLAPANRELAELSAVTACLLGKATADARRARRRSAFFIPAQAERMPGRIQQDPDVVLRLELGDSRAQAHGVAGSP